MASVANMTRAIDIRKVSGLVAAIAMIGCSSGSASRSDGGPTGAGGTAQAGTGGTTQRGTGGSASGTGGQSEARDAATDVAPRGVGNIDGFTCPSNVVCSSGLCQSGKCLPRYAWTRLVPVCGPGIAVTPTGGVALAGAETVVDLDSDGNVLWTHSYIDQAGGLPTYGGLAVLSDGSVVVAAGGILEQFDSGTTILDSTADIPWFVAKWSATGDYEWIKTFPDPFEEEQDALEIAALSVGPGDTITMGGSYHGRVNFDFDGVAPSVGTEGSRAQTVFLSQYTSDGKLGWVQSYPSSGQDDASAVAVGSDGAINLAGTFAGTGPFGTNSATSYISGPDFLAHLDASGSTTAAGTWSNTTALGSSQFWAMALDGSSIVESSTALSRLSAATGQPIWSSAGNWVYTRLAAANDFIAWGEYFKGQTDLDLGAGESAYMAPADQSTFLAAYDLTGKLLWLRQPNLPSSTAAIAPDGSVYYVNVTFEGAADYDPGPGEDILPPPSGGCYLTKFSP
jgi:hypothetical protein